MGFCFLRLCFSEDVDSFAGASGCSGRADVSNRAADGTAEGSKLGRLRWIGNIWACDSDY